MIYPDTVGCKTCLDVGIVVAEALVERIGMDPYPAGRMGSPCPDCRIGERMAAAWAKPRPKLGESSLREAGRENADTIDRWRRDLLHGDGETPMRNKLRHDPDPLVKANAMIPKQQPPATMKALGEILKPPQEQDDERARQVAAAAAKLEADYADEDTPCYGEEE